MDEKSLIDALDISVVVILDKDVSGDLYMEKLYPLWTTPIIMTLEGKYPVNSVLRDKLLYELETNPNIYCFLFGANSEKFKTKTDKRVKMGPILMKDAVRYEWMPPRFNFTDETIVELMQGFVDDNGVRLRQYNNRISGAIPESVKWYHHILKS